jgi:hypothetical protein
VSAEALCQFLNQRRAVLDVIWGQFMERHRLQHSPTRQLPSVLWTMSIARPLRPFRRAPRLDNPCRWFRGFGLSVQAAWFRAPLAIAVLPGLRVLTFAAAPAAHCEETVEHSIEVRALRLVLHDGGSQRFAEPAALYADHRDRAQGVERLRHCDREPRITQRTDES